MKIIIDVDEDIQNDEVILRCKSITDEIREIQLAVENTISKNKQIVFKKDDVEYYISLYEILFFDTEDNGVSAHVRENVYSVKYKLYELEVILPRNFARVSKSTILNINHIYSMTRSLSPSTVVTFKNTHKQVFVSRFYYKTLKTILIDRR